MRFIILESLALSALVSFYSIGVAFCLLFSLYFANEITNYLIWPILLLRLLYVVIWLIIGAWIGSNIGFFAMYFTAISASLMSVFIQYTFWKRIY
ncbi:hypothetical protein FZC35_00580 [Candidatus Cytomitobacter indipagum]|uniref:Uncharacterized protein n=1 Tax=Candidatus Cytomitobacter indipagum TaxID=2601575 RepID=A0A5C0UDR3_9PROT|nr:hypothetical protein [Candidatus Cytomitobacter indipagum]QEK37881.1 hypothetical protein FZC35_00580 [Candidatus Cytomitobacter indipagum]